MPRLALTNLSLLPQTIETPTTGLLEVLARRRSGVGGGVPIDRLGSLLWHTTQLRERGFDGRFGQWESRPAPSAGGIHSIRLLVLPLGSGATAGVYEDERHALGMCGRDASEALALNRDSVAELTGATAGTTLQLFANAERLASCYENHETLLWRDAGVIVATLCLSAEALGLTAVPLGRHGTAIVRSFGLPAPIEGLGGVHIGSRPEKARA